jgi:hypothetical protein
MPFDKLRAFVAFAHFLLVACHASTWLSTGEPFDRLRAGK